MSEKYQGKYRSESARLQNWDYGWNAAYFITICTKDRIHFFREIENKKMKLSHQGVITDLLWYEIKNHAKKIDIGDFVVMPNHVHGILILNGNVVGTTHALSLQQPEPTDPSHDQIDKTIGQQRFQNQGKTLYLQ